MPTLDRYAVIGNPIDHSQSPRIHAAFASQTGQRLEYGRILGDLEHFATQVQDFFATGGHGLNITLPFKEQAWRLADQCSSRAEIAQAANTLLRLPNGLLFADNTDGPGLVQDLLCNQLLTLSGKSVLLLGAGGAARGVLYALWQQKPARLWIANRTAVKAVALAAQLAPYSVDLDNIRGGSLEILAGERFDCIINATSASLKGVVPQLPDTCLVPDGVTYDMLYAEQPTAFVRWGLQHGAASALDGLGMLVEQAAESFLLWRGIRPETTAVLALLRPAVLSIMQP